MDVNQLRYFLAVAKSGSFSKAAVEGREAVSARRKAGTELNHGLRAGVADTDFNAEAQRSQRPQRK